MMHRGSVTGIMLIAVVSGLAGGPCLASRAQMSVGYNVRSAEVIVMADTKESDQQRGQVLLRFKEIIKGDATLRGRSHLLPPSLSTGDVFVPRSARDIAVLLGKGWATAERSPVVEVYAKPEEIDAVRMLVRIYALPSERGRILALWKASEEYPILHKQLMEDVACLHEPDNFSLLPEIYEKAEPDDQPQLVRLMAATGDSRAVPILIEAMRSPIPMVSSEAAWYLSHYFPGAPGVNAVFEQALKSVRLKDTAARYVLRYRPNWPPATQYTSQEKPATKAFTAWEAGDYQTAKTIYLECIESQNETESSRLYYAAQIIDLLTDAERDRVRAALLPILKKSVDPSKTHISIQPVQILSGLHHPDCLEPLMSLLQSKSYHSCEFDCTVTFGILELGPEARKKASAAVIAGIREAFGPSKTIRTATISDGTHPLFMQLAWLGDEKAVEEADELITGIVREYWKDVQSLMLAGSQPDEGGFLLEELANDPTLSNTVKAWIVFRLGDLKEKRAVKQVNAILAGIRTYPISSMAKTALMSIGGPEAEVAAIELISHGDPMVRCDGLEILFKLQRERTLPLLRRLVAEQEHERVKTTAIGFLARVGEPEDLKLLLPLCDFWTVNRAVQSQAIDAVSRIRERHNYDVNGPIRRERGDDR
jgi:HEAT repeat protein